MTIKLFISYRSTDSAKVDAIVARMKTIQKDGVSVYAPWQDKHDIPVGKDWWEAIVDAIIDCQIFVFNISKAALESDVCRAELGYAYKRNRPILPVVLEGEYRYNTITGKNDIDFWDRLPDELNELRSQFLFYEGGALFFQKFETSIKEFHIEPQRWRDFKQARPLDPRIDNDKSSDGGDLYDKACDYAERLDFETARKLFKRLVNFNDPVFCEDAYEWIEILNQYEAILSMDARPRTQYKVKSLWEIYLAIFPKLFLKGIFDPKGLTLNYGLGENPPINVPLQPRNARSPDSEMKQEKSLGLFHDYPITRYLRTFDLMPLPFDWITIPEGEIEIEEGGYVPLGGQIFHISKFSIAKYPITNIQFAKFIEYGGYHEKRWWTEAGWEMKEEEKRKLPRYWIDNKWNGTHKPVVGISWYESIAFCFWLSELTGETITLPTEQQWQRAAQGDDKRVYPWGDRWDPTLCNNGVNQDWRGNRTSPVNQYENKGAGPYGVVDMVGNIWEWCATNYISGMPEIDNASEPRILRGGSWQHSFPNYFRVGFREGSFPNYTSDNIGFRITCSV